MPDRQPVHWRTHPWGPTLVCLVTYVLALGAAYLAVMMVPPMHPILLVLIANVAATLVTFIVASVLGNASVYDPYWSVAPPVAFAVWIGVSGASLTGREILVMMLVLVWSLRLTWNCMRRWRDMSHEDFRYGDLKAQFPRTYPLINLFGIEMFPTLLVFGGCLPLYAVSVSGTPLGLLDVLAGVVTVSAIALEAIADFQLRRFLAQRGAGQGTVTQGVITSGVWGWSQHPNYVGEMGFWWGLWLFALAAAPAWAWTGIGAIAMTALFVFISVPMMLKRKRARHRNYDAAVEGIPVLLPLPGLK